MLSARMAPVGTHPVIAPGNHRAFMEYALEAARLSPPRADKFCVGACLVNAETGQVLSTGYSLELPGDRPGDPGRTHAEHCCFIKIADQYGIKEERIGDVLPPNTVLYTTMEPCNSRLSGNRSCVDRIIGLGDAVKTVYVGIREPDTFIAANSGRNRLEKAGIQMVFVEGLEDRILNVAMAGHEK
ncbi:hypothetical protein Hte_004408 [Hypoxylon texense]